MKKTLACLLAAILCLTLAMSYALAEEATVSAIVRSYSGILPPEENFVLDGLEEKLGFNLDIIVCATNDDYNNRLATLKAARNLPDIVPATRAELVEMVENGVVLPLDDLLKEYGQNIITDKGQYLEGYTIDGQIYGISSVGAEDIQPYMMAVRKDWLDNLGMAVPTNLDELYEVLKAFTLNDPDKNGEKDTRGLCISLNSAYTYKYVIYEAFGISPRYANLVDGKVVPDLLHPNYLEMIKYYRKLYHEGLMEPDFATRPWIQCAEDLWNGKFGAIVFAPGGTANNWMSRYSEPKPEWVFLNLYGVDGVQHGFDNSRPDLADCVAISAACENPVEAMKFLDYFVTEEAQDLILLGIEGKHFVNNEDGSASYLSPYAEDISLQRNEGGAAYAYIIGSLKHNAPTKTLNATTRDAINLGLSNPFADAVYLFTTPEIELELGSLLTDISLEAFASLIVSNGDIEAEYQSYVDKYLRSGGQEWIEQATEIYNSQNK